MASPFAQKLFLISFTFLILFLFTPALQSQDARYDKTGKFVNGYAVVVKDGKYGLIEEGTLREIAAPKYDRLKNVRRGRAVFRWGKIRGYLYPDGHESPKGCGC